MNDAPSFSRPLNEKELDYRADPAARRALDAHLATREVVEIPAVIGGQRFFSGEIEEVRAPHDHQRLLARIHKPDAAQVHQAIGNVLSEAQDWARLPLASRAPVFLRAAEIIATRARHEPSRLATAGGICPCRLALQLHRHRRQPVLRAGADGQRLPVEALA